MRRSLSQFLRELRSRGHVELPERLAQVVFDGARADEEWGGDLAVRVAIGRETRDLRLLRRELVERVGGPLSCMLARRLQFDPRALGEGVHPEVHEELVRGSELVPRIDPAGSP